MTRPAPLRLLAAGLAVVLLAGAACSDDPRREDVSTADVLTSIADGVIIPSYEALVTDVAALGTTIAAMCDAPSPEALETTRAAWRDAELAWESTRPAGVGPVAEQRAMTAIAFRIDPAKVERLLAGTDPLDQAAIGGLGSDQRGLYGIEVALFSEDSSSLVARSEGHVRRCAYATSATALVGVAADAVLDAWTAPTDPYRDTFIAGMDGDPISSVEAVVSELSFRLQQIDDQGLRSLAEVAAYDELPSTRREGPAAHGIASFRGILGGIAAVALGPDGEPGLADLVANTSGDTAERLETLVQDAVDAVGALPASSEAAFSDGGLPAAADAVAALRVLVTTEVASQLGVTIGFSDADGDS